MSVRRISIIILVLVGCLLMTRPGFAVDLKTMLQAVTRSEPFAKVHPGEVVSLLAEKSKRAQLFDANSADVRADEGIIPGARLLSSSAHYDIASELPSDKTTKLIFYCHNWL